MGKVVVHVQTLLGAQGPVPGQRGAQTSFSPVPAPGFPFGAEEGSSHWAEVEGQVAKSSHVKVERGRARWDRV